MLRPVSLLVVLAALAGSAPAQQPRLTRRDFAGLLAVSHQYLPEPAYDGWWDGLVTACGCQPAVRLEAVVWHVAPEGFACAADRAQGCLGEWTGNGDIFIARKHVMDQRLVQHEMLHAILGRGDHGHPLFRRLHLEP